MKTVFQKCPRCGSDRILWPDSRHIRCESCGLVFYRNITSAVAGFLVDAEDRMLFIRRQRDPARGMLAVPGGFVDPGESAEAALKREILEEVGLDVGPLQFLCSAPNVYTYRSVSYDVLDLFFTARVQSFAEARALDEVAGLMVARPESVSLEEIAFPSIRHALTVFRANRAG